MEQDWGESIFLSQIWEGLSEEGACKPSPEGREGEGGGGGGDHPGCREGRMKALGWGAGAPGALEERQGGVRLGSAARVILEGKEAGRGGRAEQAGRGPC